MANNLKFYNLTLLLLALSQSYEAGLFAGPTRAQLIDDDASSIDLEKIAKQVVCGDKSQSQSKELIGRVSTIVKLADYFENLPSSSVDQSLLTNCAQLNKEPLSEIKQLLTTSNKNVCGREKISLIENLHQKYLSTTAEDKAKRSMELPAAVKIFLIHYIMEVSSTCKKSLINNLEWDIKDELTEDDYKIGDGNIEKIMFGLGEQFSAMKSVNNFDDIIMLWNVIDGSVLQKDNKLMQQSSNDINDDNGINPITQERIKLFIKSKNPSTMIKLQQKCFYKFKPIYEKILLPIIDLADLGYSYTGVKFDKELQELKENQLIRRWYVLTQICETIMPISFQQDPTIVGHETVIIDKAEADKLAAEQPKLELDNYEKRVEYEPTTNSLEGLDKLYSLESDEAQNLIKSVQSNLTARDRTIRRVLVRFGKSAASFIKNKVGTFFFSRKTKDGAIVKGDLHEVAGKTLNELDEQKLLDMEGAQKHHHNDIQRVNHRVRVADVEVEQANLEAALEFQHTKSMGQILSEWYAAIQTIMPSRMMILAFGLIVCSILVFAILLVTGTVAIG